MADNKYLNLVHKMIATNRLHKKAIETVVDDIGIHRSRHHILMKLSRLDVVRSQKEIAQSLEITQAAMTVSLSKLEKDGLITRSVGKDSRYNEISITERGREIVELSRSHFSNVDSKTFEGISEDELKVFEHCLDVMTENLKKITEKEGK